ncbi:MAG TPA: FmdE family protein [Desulfomonilaceae bacterium]|nr:FmdE family protein [Desulfomonilaceae bacterium]
MNIGPYTSEEYKNLVKSFHGCVTPGLMIGGLMVDHALKHMPEGDLFDAVCETSVCLPDAIQLLTPCTIGNGGLKVLDIGRYALTLYGKYGGKGVRVYLDVRKLDFWPSIKTWFLKLEPEDQQDSNVLLEVIEEARTNILGIAEIEVQPDQLNKKRKGIIAVCPVCGEAHSAMSQGLCRACRGDVVYLKTDDNGKGRKGGKPKLTLVPLEKAVGRRVLHDMTRIIPEKEKGAAFHRGQTISAGDICLLQRMGRLNVYVEDGEKNDSEWVHEDEAALAFAQAMAGNGVSYSDTPREGKVNLIADRKGLLVVDTRLLLSFNRLSDVICASRQSYSMVDRGHKIAAVRAIPLYLNREDFRLALGAVNGQPLFQVFPLRQAKAGILVTGTEVFQGLVEDKFIPIISGKLEHLGCEVIQRRIVPDDRNAISQAISEFISAGIDLLVTTAGLSVDPDDVTKQGLLDAGASDMLYGMPVIPGAVTLLARIGHVQVIGVPACALYFKTTGFDLLLPRLLADQFPSRQDLAILGHGALCLECEECRFPQCPFGR